MMVVFVVILGFLLLCTLGCVRAALCVVAQLLRVDAVVRVGRLQGVGVEVEVGGAASDSDSSDSDGGGVSGSDSDTD